MMVKHHALMFILVRALKNLCLAVRLGKVIVVMSPFCQHLSSTNGSTEVGVISALHLVYQVLQ
jgi:hypothetical protein